MTKKEAQEYAEQYKESVAGKNREEAKAILIKDKFVDKDAEKVLGALFSEADEPVIAARKFSDKGTGKVYEAGSDISHLGEDRHEELRQRGFIK